MLVEAVSSEDHAISCLKLQGEVHTLKDLVFLFVTPFSNARLHRSEYAEIAAVYLYCYNAAMRALTLPAGGYPSTSYTANSTSHQFVSMALFHNWVSTLIVVKICSRRLQIHLLLEQNYLFTNLLPGRA